MPVIVFGGRKSFVAQIPIAEEMLVDEYLKDEEEFSNESASDIFSSDSEEDEVKLSSDPMLDPDEDGMSLSATVENEAEKEISLKTEERTSSSRKKRSRSKLSRQSSSKSNSSRKGNSQSTVNDSEATETDG